MAPVISGTSPDVVTGNGTGTLTTASFTPAADSIIVAIAVGGYGTTAGSVASATISDSGGGSWTTRVTRNDAYDAAPAHGVGGVVRISTISAGSSPVARTVSANFTNLASSSAKALAVFVVTGASLTPGATGSVDSASATSISCPITTTNAGSLILGGFDKQRPNETVTAGGNCTFTTGLGGSNPWLDATGNMTTAFIKSTSVPGSPGATTYAISYATTWWGKAALIEILPGANTDVPATDITPAANEAASVRAYATGTDTGSAADTAILAVVGAGVDTGSAVDVAGTLRNYATETGGFAESVHVIADGANLSFGTDNATGADTATVKVYDGDTATAFEVPAVGYQGLMPPGPRIVRIRPNT